MRLASVSSRLDDGEAGCVTGPDDLSVADGIARDPSDRAIASLKADASSRRQLAHGAHSTSLATLYARLASYDQGDEDDMTLEHLRERVIALQQELGAAWEAATEVEDDLEEHGKLDSVPLTSVPLQAASDAANTCRLAIESAMFRAGTAPSH